MWNYLQNSNVIRITEKKFVNMRMSLIKLQGQTLGIIITIILDIAL